MLIEKEEREAVARHGGHERWEGRRSELGTAHHEAVGWLQDGDLDAQVLHGTDALKHAMCGTRTGNARSLASAVQNRFPRMPRVLDEDAVGE